MDRQETVGGALKAAADLLAQAGIADADREAAWLLAEVMKTSAGALRLQRQTPLTPSHWEAFAGFVARRAAHEPIQYILGTEEFMGLTFRVTPDVLIPRMDTATLVQAVLAQLPPGPLTVGDIGTGSGAIAVSVAHHRPNAQVIAVDISPAALTVAADNARLNGVADRVQFRQGDLVAPLVGGQCHAILSNPPYIPAADIPTLMPDVREYEPHLALTPGEDGLLMYRRLAREAPPLLTPGGILAVEVGIHQAQDVARLFTEAGLTAVQVYQDTAGIDRVVLGHRPAHGRPGARTPIGALGLP